MIDDLPTRTLFTTVVGSHAWNMARSDSDVDKFVGYQVPSKYILTGDFRWDRGSFIRQGNEDVQAAEIGKIVDMLLKGNINYIIYVMSPIIVETTTWHMELRKIVEENKGKNIYLSVHGMSVHNWEKYIDEMTHKKFNQIARVIRFAVNWMLHDKVAFEPTDEEPSDERFYELLDELNSAYEGSDLPKNPDREPFRQFLYDVRLDYMEGTL